MNHSVKDQMGISLHLKHYKKRKLLKSANISERNTDNDEFTSKHSELDIIMSYLSNFSCKMKLKKRMLSNSKISINTSTNMRQYNKETLSINLRKAILVNNYPAKSVRSLSNGNYQIKPQTANLTKRTLVTSLSDKALDNKDEELRPFTILPFSNRRKLIGIISNRSKDLFKIKSKDEKKTKKKWYDIKPRIIINQYYKHNFITGIRMLNNNKEETLLKGFVPNIADLLTSKKNIKKFKKSAEEMIRISKFNERKKLLICNN